jgi:hypothetical protein
MIEAIVIFLLVYFVPWIVAARRHHRQKLAIGMLNLFGGWTIVGWVPGVGLHH